MTVDGLKILLTNYDIANYTGSEIDCLSLGRALSKMGADVEVATLNYAYPLRSEFEESHISVKNVFFDEFSYRHYDVIWAHHPIVLTYILFELGISAERIIFNSLSPSEPHEAPPGYANRLNMILANSEETAESIEKTGVKKELISVFPNYISREDYDRGPVIHQESLRSIAIISNHVPEELKQAIYRIRETGLRADIYGQGNIETLVTDSLLRQYDAVVSIGKTVQYALGAGIPVYCYDIHGGPGWLSENVLEKAYRLNFSGRGFKKKTSDEIYIELLDNQKYNSSVESSDALRMFIGQNCILEDNLENVLKHCLKTVPVSPDIIIDYSGEGRRNNLLISYYRYNLYREMKITELTGESEKTRRENEEEMDRINEQLENLNNNYQQLLGSLSAVLSEKAEADRKHELAAGELKSDIEHLEELCSQKEETIVLLKEKLDQKEANCKYLIELCDQKEQKIVELQNEKAHNDWLLSEILKSKAWKLVTKYRNFKAKIKDFFSGKRKRNASGDNKAITAENKEEPAQSVKENMPLVTVGIPVYDRTDVLRECIESLLRQTYKKVEIIAVCDGSPDETLEIVRDYENRGLIRAYYYKDNSGNAVRGRNKAIREAKGVYYAFMDSDDVAEPDRISKSVDCMEKSGADVVYGGWRALVDGTRSIDIKDGQEVFSPDCDYEMLKTVCVPCQSTVMAKTDVLRKAGGLKTDMRYREDHELWLRLAYLGYKFKAVDSVLINLRLHSGNLELSFKESDDKWYRLMLEEHKKAVTMKPKVAYLIPGCGISGGIAVICQHVNRLRQRGFDVLLITESDEREIKWFPNQMVDIVGLDEAPDNIDILVATGWSTAYSAQKIAAKEKYYFVQSDETRFSPEGSEAYNRAMETYGMDFKYITEAKWIQKWLHDRFGKEAEYVPNGLDQSIIFCTEERKEIPDRKLRVLLEGPIDIPYKGMADAFAAVEGLDCEVWCISSAGEPRPEWKCDRFFSKVPMAEMRDIYSQCDILLKMSRVEGFFGPPMEMMACGGTCVVGKVTGYDEYIVDEYNALVVEQRDVFGAHNALKRLLEDPGLRKTLSENGKRTAEEWNWDRSIDTLEKLYSHDI